MKIAVEKSKVNETIGVLSLACIVLQIAFSDQLIKSEWAHNYMFALIAGVFLAITLFSSGVVGFALLVANFIFKDFAPNWFLAIIGGVLIIFSFFPIKLDQLISYLWLKLGEGMGFIMSKLVLGSVFYVLVSPLSIVFRLFNKNHLKLNRSGNSYYVERNHEFKKKDLENIW